MVFVFWQNIVSPHQAGFMRALAERGHDVTVVARQTMSVGRQRLGWEPPHLGPARVVIGPGVADMRRLIHEGPAEAIHLIAGARIDRTGAIVARACRAAGRRMGIITETPDPRGLGGLLRWGKYAAERMLIGRSFDFVLAMGATGVRWFRNCGYPASRVFACAYVTDPANPQSVSFTSDRFRALYVGQLIPRKGVDVLIKAVAGVAEVELDMIGDGTLRESLHLMADRCGLGSRIHWHGTMSSADVGPRLSQADVLILPSRHDGWGAVVNEALMLGTPVICSSACGASDLLQHEWLGAVVPPDDVDSLQAVLATRAARGRCTAGERGRIREWARCITGESVAAYLEAVMHHVYGGNVRPVAPWRMST